jgi:hypothetical protein
MSERTRELLEALKAWCDLEYGRRAEAARAIGTTRQTVSDWFAGRKQLTGEQALAAQAFLAKQRRRR